MTDQITEAEREVYMQSIISRQKLVDGFVIGFTVGCFFVVALIVWVVLAV